MRRKKWIISSQDQQKTELLEHSLGIPSLAAKVLVARGVDDEKTAREYLEKDISHLHDPFLLKDMDAAVERIRRAVRDGEQIAIYGDYDVDGVTSTCIMVKYLSSLGAKCNYYIPNRINEGYGLNVAAIQTLHDQGSTLLITVDSGITAIEEAEFAYSIGMDLIITDHHECKDGYPKAVAVINPRRPDGGYPYRELAGVGVAFKLICAMEGGYEQALERFADIVAVGTIADVMPLTGENRLIVINGLQKLAHTSNLGLRALINKLGLDSRKMTSNNVSFIIAPRINAAGRMGGASVAAQLFLTEDENEAAELADRLCELNTLRQQEENNIYSEIIDRIDRAPELAKKKILIMWGRDWHSGVIGIVASRLSERFGVPCILLSVSEGLAKGSGRSIQGFNLHSALSDQGELIETFGGHELAVGLTVREELLEQFRTSMERYAEECFIREDIVPSVQVDCEVTPDELTIEEVAGLSVLEPFGMGNLQPVFVMRGLRVEEITPISHDKHLKMTLSKDEHYFQALVFGIGTKQCPYVRDDEIDMVFTAEINVHKGRQSVQFVIKDSHRVQRLDDEDNAAADLYKYYRAGNPISRDEAIFLSPSRADLVAVFRHIRANAENGAVCGPARTIYRRIRYESGRALNLARFLICIDVFSEFDIFSSVISSDGIVINDTDYQGKVNICGSKILKELMDIIKG